MSDSSYTEAEELPTDTYEYIEYYEDEGVIEEETGQLLSEDFISGPVFSANSTVPEDIFELDYSYGYDCKKYFNLVAPDESTVVYASGNLINVYNVQANTLQFRRSYLGGGIGHITLNPCPKYSHLTVAENGDNPPIIIYEWPSLEIVGILREGAAKRYAHINYSPDGELLVSQSYEPDFLITVWQWKKWRRSPIILRKKSHVHDVYRCMFSPYVPGQITTGGSGHIKFWKMAQTFTGLKLEGDLGRFGKTEISDVVAIYPMPDEKVISGSEWGNLLVWEAGLIKIEVFRTLRRKCHSQAIMQLEYIRSRGEIWSISLDGWLRAWEYRIIDEADPPDEDRVVQMIPSYERQNQGLQCMCVTKRKMHDPDDTFYYAQDGNGGIWLIDLILRVDFEPSECLKIFHAGPIVDIATCPWGPYVASLGIAGTFFVYNYLTKKLILNYKFVPKGRALMWLPLDVDATGTVLFAGFDDGVVRVCVIQFIKPENPTLTIVQSIKPHNKPLTTFTINQSGTLFVSGAEDKTIFVCSIQNENNQLTLIPIGFIPLETIPTCFAWNPRDDSDLLVGCIHGTIFKFELPTKPVDYTTISYLLHTVKPIKKQFESCKSKIRQDILIEDNKIQKADKIDRKKKEMLQIKAENPGLDIDEELYLQDSDSEEIFEPLYIPEVPNPVLFMMYTPENTVWLSMGGYDAGYIYEYNVDLPKSGFVKATMVYDADEIEINGFIYSPDDAYLITSMQRGQIRVNKINEDDFRDLSNNWILAMHDNFNGRISKMCFSYDNFFFFSAGDDGNLFSYKYNPVIKLHPMRKPYLAALHHATPITKDETYKSYSLEETMINAEQDKQMRLANEHKKKLKNRLSELTVRLSSLLDRNCEMPKSQRYNLKDFIIDERIMQALDNKLSSKIALEKRKLEYDVEKSATGLRKMREHYTECLDVYPIQVKGINITETVETISQSKLGQEFYKTLRTVEQKVMEEFLRGRIPERETIVGEKKVEQKKKTHELEPFLVGLSPSTIEFRLGEKLSRLLQAYREKKANKERRQEEWNDLYSKKPTQGVSPKEDEAALNRARFGIGDYKLKSSPDYKVPPHLRETTVRKYQELLETRMRAYNTLTHEFNRKVYRLRDKKVALIENLKKKLVSLKKVHVEIPVNRIIQAPAIPTMTPEDFPEKEMEMKMNVENDFRSSLNKKKSKGAITSVVEEIEIEKVAFGITRFRDIKGKTRDIITENVTNFDPFTMNIPTEGNPLREEIKMYRFVRNLFFQDIFIGEMKQMIKDFDHDLQQLLQEKFDIRMQSSYMDLNILVLNQELIIVQEFESVETELSEIARDKYNELLDMRDHIKRLELKIEAHGDQIDVSNNQIKDLQQTFTSAAKDNKFWDFLRRIFKKKYRPPKIINPEESESSSYSSESSSESEEDDTGSIDSRDIGPIRLDENICPKGCDRELYDYTFVLRNKRHELEKEIKEEQKSIELLKKELEHAGKKLKVCEQVSKKSNDELEEYQCMKQRKLNEIPCTVVLKLSQLQHSTNDETRTFVKPSDTILFGIHAMRSLLNRVDELKNETIEERGRFRRNKMHLHRMQVDCEYMSKRIKKLREDIIEKMVIKFGNKVNIDDLEEAILKRMVQDMKLAMLKIGTEYHDGIEEYRKIYSEKQTELKDIIRENTARIELYNVLNKEKSKLAKILEKQKLNKEKMLGKDFSYYVNDLDKLTSVATSQQEKIQMLKDEIKMLSTKTMPMEHVKPLQPPQQSATTAEEVELANVESFDDLYVYIPPTKEKEIAIPAEAIMPVEIEEEKVSEHEIQICIQELMTEIVESSMKTSSSVEIAVLKILSEIIDQIPIKYLKKTSSMEFVAGLMRDLVDEVKKVDSTVLSEEIAKKTTVSEEDIMTIINYILSTIATNDKE